MVGPTWSICASNGALREVYWSVLSRELPKLPVRVARGHGEFRTRFAVSVGLRDLTYWVRVDSGGVAGITETEHGPCHPEASDLEGFVASAALAAIDDLVSEVYEDALGFGTTDAWAFPPPVGETG